MAGRDGAGIGAGVREREPWQGIHDMSALDSLMKTANEFINNIIVLCTRLTNSVSPYHMLHCICSRVQGIP